MRQGALVVLLCVASAGIAGCRSDAHPIGVPMNERTRWESEWKRYLRFADQKALAVAGDIEGQFVRCWNCGANETGGARA